MDQKGLLDIENELENAMDKVMVDVEDMVEVASKDLALLQNEKTDDAVNDAAQLLEDSILKRVHLPWYVPESFVRAAVGLTIKRVVLPELQKKNA